MENELHSAAPQGHHDTASGTDPQLFFSPHPDKMEPGDEDFQAVLDHLQILEEITHHMQHSAEAAPAPISGNLRWSATSLFAVAASLRERMGEQGKGGANDE